MEGWFQYKKTMEIFLRILEWSVIIWADIVIGALAPSAQIMSDQITSDKVILLKETVIPKNFENIT